MASLLALVPVVLSCGNGDITRLDGSWGAERINTRVDLVLQPASVEVDICDAISVGLVANITTEQIDPELPPNELHMEGYEIVFEPSYAEAPDIQGGKYVLGSALPSDGLDLFFIDPGNKAFFLNDINSGLFGGVQSFQTYSARYIIYGTDSFTGSPKSWGVRSSFSFKMGRYSTCVPSIVPSAVTIKVKYNPDADPSDDITFTISGGTAPYSVISNSVYIESPGNLGIGTMSFTVDPNMPLITTIATLTVTDSANQKVIATVNLNP